jgi:excisionase family DNA binding protein
MAIKKTALNALDLMTTNDVAKELGVTIRSVQLWVEQGALEGWKTPGGHRRITRASFNRFITGKSHLGKSEINQNEVAQNKAYLSTSKKPAINESRLKVVVVEDDQAMLMLYRMTIESWKLPIDVRFISNGYEAIVSISQNTPDLLITDLKMPEMDGFAMLKALRNMDDFSLMTIVVVTGMQAHEIDDKGGIPRGVSLYGKSPVPFLEMRELMQSLVEKKHDRFAT